MLLNKVVCRGRETQWQQLVDRGSMAGQQMKQQLILFIFQRVPVLFISKYIFLFLDSNRAALYDSQLKIIPVYLILRHVQLLSFYGNPLVKQAFL